MVPSRCRDHFVTLVVHVQQGEDTAAALYRRVQKVAHVQAEVRSFFSADELVLIPLKILVVFQKKRSTLRF